MKTIRFIHSADLHLGSPLLTVGAMSTELQRILREASFNSLERIVDAALLHQVDFLLFSGDIYDRDSRSVRANEFLARQMERLCENDIPVCIIYGNHDPLGTTADLYKMPSNVKVFSCHQAECFPILDSNNNTVARIFGQSYRHAAENRKMHKSFAPQDGHILNIGMLHTALIPGTRSYVPSSLEELRQINNIHYWALGHIHRPCICSLAAPAAAFPGIPQGRDFNDPGVGGCLLVEAEAADLEPKIGKVPTIKFLPLSQVIWLTETLSIEEETPKDLDALEEMITSRCQEIIAQGPEAFYPPIPVVDNNTYAGTDTFLPGSPDSSLCNLEPKGYIVRWEISGRGRLHEALEDQDREELSQTLANRLRQAVGKGTPFLWTTAVNFRTAAPIGGLNLLAQQDPVFSTLLERQKDFKEQPELRKEIEKVMGKVWYRQQDAEDLREDSLPYNDTKLNELLDRAYSLVLDRIIRERENL